MNVEPVQSNENREGHIQSCIGYGTEICYKKCRLVKNYSILKCQCACCKCKFH